MRRLRPAKIRGFTLIEITVASIAVTFLLIAVCGIYQFAIKRWDIQTSQALSIGEADTALERMEADAQFAVSFATVASGANTLYVFTLPANTDANGNYIPQRVGGNVQYVAGPKVCFYLSNIGGATNVANGTILWRGTSPAGSAVYTPDRSWSLVNTTVARCPKVSAFSISSAAMPNNAVLASVSVNNTSGNTTQSCAVSRELHMACGPTVTAPANLQASSGSSIVLTWNPVPGAATYRVYRGISAGGEALLAANVPANSYTDATAAAGTVYYYEVTAVNGTESPKSNEASALAGYVTATPTTPGTSLWYGEEDLNVSSTQPITALTATITSANSTGCTPIGPSNTFTAGNIADNMAAAGGNEVFSYSLNAGRTQAAGNYKLAADFNLTGAGHPTAGDTYAMTVTAGGITQTLTGTF